MASAQSISDFKGQKSLGDQKYPFSKHASKEEDLTGANRIETSKHEQDARDAKSSHGIQLATRRRSTRWTIRCTAVSKALDLNDAPGANPCGEVVRKSDEQCYPPSWSRSSTSASAPTDCDARQNAEQTHLSLSAPIRVASPSKLMQHSPSSHV